MNIPDFPLLQNMMWSALDVPVNIAEWAMAELVCHPEIQKKLQAEIDNVVSHGRAVQESDIANLPYLRCVIKEVSFTKFPLNSYSKFL